MVVINFIVNQVLRELSIFLGLITLLGCIFLRKPLHESLVSAVKTLAGVRILQIGTTVMVEYSKPMMNMLIASTGLEGRVADGWVGVGEILERLPATLSGQVGMLLIGAWLLHLVFARITPFKNIYLTMQVAYIDAVWVLWGVTVVTGWLDLRAYALTGLMLALYWTIFPFLAYSQIKFVAGDENVTLGHNTTMGAVLAGWLTRFAPKSQSAEELSLPGWLGIFKDNVVSYIMVMGAIFTLIGVAAGSQVGSQYSNGNNYLMFSFMQGVAVAAGMLTLVFGVKMMLAELLPAFQGFATKVVPGARAAIDAPVFLTYRPQAAMIGFLASLLGMVTGVAIQVVFGFGFITIPSVLPIFFGGSLFGVIADARSGWKGAVLSSFLLGILLIIGAALYAQVTDMRMAAGANMDFVVVWLPLFTLIKTILR